VMLSDDSRHELAISLSAASHWLHLLICIILSSLLCVVYRIQQGNRTGSRLSHYGRHTRPLLINRTNAPNNSFPFLSFFFSKSFSIASPVSVFGSLTLSPFVFSLSPSIEQVSIILLIFVVSNPKKSPASTISKLNSIKLLVSLETISLLTTIFVLCYPITPAIIV
jgi:hypothetical protein